MILLRIKELSSTLYEALYVRTYQFMQQWYEELTVAVQLIAEGGKTRSRKHTHIDLRHAMTLFLVTPHCVQSVDYICNYTVCHCSLCGGTRLL